MGKKIMLVDDSVSESEILKELLEIRGFCVSYHRSYHSAMSFLDEGHDFDLALIDIQLHDRSGLELGKEIRGRYPDKHVVMLSGFDYDSRMPYMYIKKAPGVTTKILGTAERLLS